MITGTLERSSREARSRVSGSQARGWRGRRTIRFFVSSPDVSWGVGLASETHKVRMTSQSPT